jgi:branched-chain amino acid transport system substrate-binding protein
MALGDGEGAAPGAIPRLDLMVRDDKNDPEACLQAFKDLKASGCSVVVLGTPSQAATKAVPWAIENGILVITPTVSSPIEGDASRLYIRVNMPSSEYGKALAQAATERFHEMRVGIIGDSRNSSYVDAVKGVFLAEYARLGGTASFDLSFDSSKGIPGSDLVAEIRSKGCDGLLAIAASTEVVLMAKELERDRLHVQFLLPPWPLTLDLIQNGGAAVEGAVAVSIADLAYRSEYGEAPSFTAMFGWEAASVLRAALASSDSTTPKALSDRIIAIKDFDGLQGKIEFNADGKATRTMFLFKIEGGAFHRID